MRVFLVVLLSVFLAAPSFAKKKAKTESFTGLEQVTDNQNLTLSLDQDDFSQDLNNGPINLSFLLNASSLIKSGIYPTSFKTEIYAVNDDASKDLLTIYRPTIFSSKKAQNLVFDLPLLNLVKTSELEINLYDTNNSLVAIFKANIEVENPSSTVFSAVPDSDCTGVFGECHLEYILQNIHFVGKRAKDIQTTVEKNLDGSYLVNLPLSKSNKAQKIINRINGNSNPGTNSNLNLEFDGTNLFVVAEDGTKTQVAAQGPQGEAGEPGSVGPSGPQGPQGATGVGVTGAAGATGAVQYNVGGALTADTANFFWDTVNGTLNIGGNATPIAVDTKLHVETNVGGQPWAYFRDNALLFGLFIKGLTGRGAHIQASGGDSLILSSHRTDNPDIVIDTAGRVGMGTFNPASKLQVNGEVTISTTSPVLHFNDTDAGSSRPRIQVNNNNSFYLYGDDSFAPQRYHFMSSFSNGRTNDATLRVHGDTATSGASWDTYIELKHDGTQGQINTDLGDIDMIPESAQVFVHHHSSNGRVQLNSYDGSIEIVSGDNNGSYIDFKGNSQVGEDFRGRITYVSNQSDGYMGFLTYNGVSSTAQMVITENGNVGVGPNLYSPQRTLHIDDLMRIQPRSTAPSSPALGDVYVDSDTNELCFYNGTVWVGLVAAGACS